MLSIVLVLPDVLATYGDDGNALVLRGRARMRGIDAELVPVRLGEAVPATADLYCIGGGEDTAQILAAEHLRADGNLARAAAAGRPILGICAGLQVLGESFRADGRMVDGVGLIDATTSSLASRTIGELASMPHPDCGLELTQPLTGFENHMGATLLGPDARPFAQVTRGVGNCDAHGSAGDSAQVGVDGAVQGSVIATYMHGPALARNPELADLLLARALGVSPSELAPLDIPAVEALRHERLRA